jgi:hypothetical protein
MERVASDNLRVTLGRRRLSCSYAYGGRCFPLIDYHRNPIPIRSAIGQSNVQTVHARRLAGL